MIRKLNKQSPVMRFAHLLIYMFFFLIACESESPLLPESELVVVRAYLYAGEPVTNIKNGLGIFSGFSSRAVEFIVKVN